MKNYMFDTNIFNCILDKKISLSSFVGKGNFYSTHIQQDEINKTKDANRRIQLSNIFNSVCSNDISTSSIVFGVSRFGRAKFGGNSISIDSILWESSTWDQYKWGVDDGLYQPIKEKLDNLNKEKKNNSQDALIAETSIKNGFILVTHDKDLYFVTTYYRGACANFYQLLNEISIK